jgi:hypothetical protein
MNIEKTELERAQESARDLFFKIIFSALSFAASCLGVISGVIVAVSPNRVEIYGACTSYTELFDPIVVSRSENLFYGVLAVIFSVFALLASLYFLKRLLKAFKAEKQFIEKHK